MIFHPELSVGDALWIMRDNKPFRILVGVVSAHQYMDKAKEIHYFCYDPKSVYKFCSYEIEEGKDKICRSRKELLKSL